MKEGAMILKPIETKYAGRRFRSRLEARWAVFFDSLGVAWDYEKEGYSLPSGPYLPDFWLPANRWWVEIKGQKPNDREKMAAHELAVATGCPVLIFAGSLSISPTPDRMVNFDIESFFDYEPSTWIPELCRMLQAIYFPEPGEQAIEDNLAVFLRSKGIDAPSYARTAECIKRLIELDIEYRRANNKQPEGWRYGCHRESFLAYYPDIDRDTRKMVFRGYDFHSGKSPTFHRALNAALSARFEFGESGGRNA
jgi:hypothetical protein